MATSDHSPARADTDAVLAEWAALAARPESALDLVEAAILVARPVCPDLEVAHYADRIDALAAGVSDRLDGDESELQILLATTAFLFIESAFAGDREDYYDERNSLLHEVIERRVGIPITLSVVLIGVAERLGLDVHGIGFPGHFLVGARVPDLAVIDPFRGGRLLSTEDCAMLVHQVTAGGLSFRPEMLNAATKREVLARILRNLKAIHARAGDMPGALLDAERIVLLLPREPSERRDRGLLRLANGRLRGAVDDLQLYLEAVPVAQDVERVAAHLKQARARLYQLN